MGLHPLYDKNRIHTSVNSIRHRFDLLFRPNSDSRDSTHFKSALNINAVSIQSILIQNL